jgi:ABC-type phosphate transport system ATPase subunit
MERQLFTLKDELAMALVTHIFGQAKSRADYVIFLYPRQLVKQGPTEPIFTNPNDPRAKFTLDPQNEA